MGPPKLYQLEDPQNLVSKFPATTPSKKITQRTYMRAKAMSALFTGF